MNNKIRQTKIVYKTLRIKSDTKLSHELILNRYNVDSKIINENNSPLLIGFDTDLNESIVSEILNAGWELVSVSEDSNSICYHLTYTYDE